MNSISSFDRFHNSIEDAYQFYHAFLYDFQRCNALGGVYLGVSCNTGVAQLELHCSVVTLV